MTFASAFPTGSAGAGIIAAVVVIAVGAVIWAIASAFTRERRPELTQTLSPYSVGQLAETHAAPEVRTGGTQELVETAIVQRAVEAVGELARERGILQYLEAKLEQANLPVRSNEAFFLYLVAIIVSFFLGLIGNILVAVIVAVIVGVAPWAVLNFLAEKRTKTFTSQLPDMLQLLATTLRSGFSILQGLETVSRQLPEPIGEEMRHVVAESRLGRPLIQALDDVAKKVHSDDFDWVVQAIAIQREVGGNLAELLDIVAATMQERERLRREVQTLTAEGRIGAIIISVLPVAIGLFVYAVNPSYITPLWHSIGGKISLFGSIGLAVVGILWLRNIVQIEI
jgi:tight adherence protein B